MYHFVLSESAVSQVVAPPGLSRSRLAYRVNDNRLAPAVKAGDIVCCSTELLRHSMLPALAIVILPAGGCRLVSSMRPLRPISAAYAVTHIIKG